MAEMGIFEVINTARALRRFKPDPVPDEVMTKVLDAAIRAPSGSNEQTWQFIVIKDAAQRKKIGDIYRKGGQILMALYANRVRPEHMPENQFNKLMASATYLIDHMGDAPVLLLACLQQAAPSGPPPQLPPEAAAALKNLGRMSGSSIYPAVQNVILACRALGLGTCLTTIHMFYEDEVRAALGLPADVQTYALLPIGYPSDKFGQIKRKPLAEVVHLDRWNNHWKA